MSWLNGLSQDEKDEMYLDACSAYNAGIINDRELREALARLGYNATDIEEIERQHRPAP